MTDGTAVVTDDIITSSMSAEGADPLLLAGVNDSQPASSCSGRSACGSRSAATR